MARTGETKRDDPVVYLVTVANEPLARMWVETLRQNGIAAMAKPLGPGFGAWGSSFTFEHELHVLESQHEAALAIVRDLEGAEVWDVPGDVSDETVDPIDELGDDDPDDVTSLPSSTSPES